MKDSSASIQLRLLSFDASGQQVVSWLREVLGKWSGDLWLLLEQMHRFDFVGPGVADICPLIVEDSVGVYGLRGRLFWERGQIEWRRLGPTGIRVVAITEEGRVVAPNSPESKTEVCEAYPEDSRLVLWGTSRAGGPFRELRVAGSDDIPYPNALTKAVAGQKEVCYPVLRVRTYLDLDGQEMFWRFLAPAVCTEKELENV